VGRVVNAVAAGRYTAEAVFGYGAAAGSWFHKNKVVAGLNMTYLIFGIVTAIAAAV